MNKLCTGCDEIKPLDSFHLNRATPDGHKNICKQCSKEYAQHYYSHNRATRIKRVLDWQRANPDKVEIYKKRYLEKQAAETQRRYLERRILKKLHFHPDFRVPPGESVREFIESTGLSRKDLLGIGFSRREMREIASSKIIITKPFARKLERLQGPSATFWVSLQKNYDGA